MMFCFGIVCLIIGIGLFMLTALKNDKIYAMSAFMCAIIFTVFGIILIIVQTADDLSGYGVRTHLLPIHGVCEIVYVGDEVTTTDIVTSTALVYYPTLIKLPNNKLRLFDLEQKMTPGLVKAMPNHTLIPFLPEPTTSSAKE